MAVKRLMVTPVLSLVLSGCTTARDRVLAQHAANTMARVDALETAPAHVRPVLAESARVNLRSQLHLLGFTYDPAAEPVAMRKGAH